MNRHYKLYLIILVQGKILIPKIQKILKLCKYIRDFLLITTQFLFAAQIHSKGGEINHRKLGYFSILCYST